MKKINNLNKMDLDPQSKGDNKKNSLFDDSFFDDEDDDDEEDDFDFDEDDDEEEEDDGDDEEAVPSLPQSPAPPVSTPAPLKQTAPSPQASQSEGHTQVDGKPNMEDIQFRLGCELGQVYIPYNHLQNLNIGSVVNFNNTLQTLYLCVNNVRVGEGMLVDIDGKIGIKITRWYNKV